MKRYIGALAFLTASLMVTGQTTEDAIRFTSSQPTGTARSMSLGNAMGSLGGDYSSIGINPAGIAVYRSSEFTFTPSFRFDRTEADYYGLKTDDDRITMPFQQIGFVGTYKPIREATSGIISTHFAIGYNRNKTFSRKTYINGLNIGSSLLDMFTHNANMGRMDNLYERLAYDAFLLDRNPFASEVASMFPNESYPHNYLNAFEYNRFNVDDENGFPSYDLAVPQWGPLDGINQTRILSESGSSGEFNIAAGANISHTFYIGASLGIPVFSYTRNMDHFEEVAGGRNNYANFPEQLEGYYEYRWLESEQLWLDTEEEGFFGLDDYTFRERITTRATGINLKTGIIYKPINALRIGAAFHTPTFFSVDNEYTTRIIADQFLIDLSDDEETYLFYDLDRFDERRYAENSYNFRTPFKAIGSVSYLFGTRGLISVDYEYTDNTSMQYRSKSSSIADKAAVSELNNQINNTFRATHNLRFGAEFRPTETVTLRGGFANYQSPYQSNHFRSGDKTQTYSFGVGYRMQNMFVDVAYMMRNQKYMYSMYYAPHIEEEFQEPVSMIANTHTLAVTLGWRF
ncbi:OmpP1/FadL family transporter [Alkalitalea saponilacus]|uniref:Outer membrane protein transport protein (OMPP1/FadL/TodX) n=1 Tax=Alkalitalea saponilacus TaxID=889453 RepID=A0A1T5HH74_9BACT|nr:outer membrane protein transport protein [Alkalitalea saponilacus]ASB48136.1 hydrocarbon degradation protein [Alkalitalea saponilacus]SKC20013.1 Outer membrane protein transport protein (OMPP1/FadL/TodX) [Alkalitalea saponilacus]